MLTTFNIPTLLEDVENIRELWIESPAAKLLKVVTKEGLETYQLIQEPASDLRAELYGALPRKLKSLTISGAGFNRLADGILNVNSAPFTNNVYKIFNSIYTNTTLYCHYYYYYYTVYITVYLYNRTLSLTLPLLFYFFTFFICSVPYVPCVLVKTLHIFIYILCHGLC